jgi:hypothetical protein
MKMAFFLTMQLIVGILELNRKDLATKFVGGSQKWPAESVLIGSLQASLQPQKILNELPTFGVLIVEEFGMELDSV